MGWSVGYDGKWDRDIGYAVPGICDYPGCGKEIDRGLSYVCANEEPFGGLGCGLYFCSDHRSHYKKHVGNCCIRCFNDQEPFRPTPDTLEWIGWKLTDDSWKIWRDQNPEKVRVLEQMVEGTRYGTPLFLWYAEFEDYANAVSQDGEVLDTSVLLHAASNGRTFEEIMKEIKRPRKKG